MNGLCYEHSPSEGIAVIQLMEEFLDNCADLEPSTTSVPPVNTDVHPLRWNISGALENHLQFAAQSIDKLVIDVNMLSLNVIYKCLRVPSHCI